MDKKEMREFLKDSIRKEIDFTKTDQYRKKEKPPIQYQVKEGDKIVPLPQVDRETIKVNLMEIIGQRKTRRKYKNNPMTLQELSNLLWGTAGVRKEMDQSVLRSVPSAGNRHPIDTFLAIQEVEGLDQGIYRYLPLDHALVLVDQPEDFKLLNYEALLEQPMALGAGVIFYWVAVPYRTEWRYDKASVKVIAIDAGHICQNLYLMGEAMGLGVCAIAAYDQEKADKLLKLDTKEEIAIYMATVGRQIN